VGTPEAITGGIGAQRRSEAFLPLQEESERRIRHVKRRVAVSDLWRTWPVIRVVGSRDLKVKYKQSLLGPIWLFVQPFGLLIAFVIAFGSLADVGPAGVSYGLYVLVGLSAWTYFQAVLNMGSVSMISNELLVRRTPAPRLAFPVGSLIANSPVLAVTLAVTLAWALVEGELSARMVLLPLLLVWLVCLALGTVLLLASFAVRFRDVISALPFIVQIGVFVTPIAYSVTDLDGAARVAVAANPMTGLVEAWRWAVLSNASADVAAVLAGLAGTAALLTAGWLVFGRLETRMADVI
jgi:ABC-type polysaccharide/polyol phosphate export permease